VHSRSSRSLPAAAAFLREQRGDRIGTRLHAAHTGGYCRQSSQPLKVVADRHLPPRRVRVDTGCRGALELSAEDIRRLLLLEVPA
jgi:hypothetical protein